MIKLRSMLALLATTGALGAAPAAQAISRPTAHAVAALWIHQHCGEAGYHCDWWVLKTLTATGINKAGQAQYKFMGEGSETKNVKNPFLPRHVGALYAGGITPYGKVINAVALVSPVLFGPA